MSNSCVIAAMESESSPFVKSDNKEVIGFKIDAGQIEVTTFTSEDKKNVSMSGDGLTWVWEGTYKYVDNREDQIKSRQAIYIRVSDGEGNLTNYVLNRNFDQTGCQPKKLRKI